MDDSFFGDDFCSWATHFRLSAQLVDYLRDEGVEILKDLEDLYSDVEMLNTLKTKVSPIEFRRFLRAASRTKILNHVVVPAPFGLSSEISTGHGHGSPLPKPPAVLLPPPPPIPSTATKLAEEERKLMEELEALKKSKLSETAVRIQKLKEEKERLESIEKTAHTARKDEERARSAELEKTKQRKSLIDKMDQKLREASSLDMVFMLDCTGSMGGYIASAKNDIKDFVENLLRVVPDIPLRLAFVGYRDHCDGPQRLAVFEFSTDVEAFKAFVGAQAATGGGDAPEDVFGALNVVSNLNWNSALRMLYHIADAPCHGNDFHDPSMDDSHPSGDPLGLSADVLLRNLQGKNVEYFFGKINDSTNIMIDQFNKITGGGKYVSTTPMSAGTMMTTILTSVSLSLTASLTSSARTEEGGGLVMKEVLLVPAMPSWGLLPTENAARYGLKLPTSILDLAAATTDKCINDFPDPAIVTLKVAANPFAKGEMRATYYSQEVLAGGRTEIVVVKESMAASIKHLTRDKYEAYLACQAASIYLANEFNKLPGRPSGCSGIEFCNTSLLQFNARASQPFFIQEAFLQGHFEKYNNNSGICAPFPTAHGTMHEVVQAFSHWTYVASSKRLMVVDCQGCFNSGLNKFLLTDPAIHCTTLLRFGGTNMGATGFKNFFKTHRCNDICRGIGLPPHA